MHPGGWYPGQAQGGQGGYVRQVAPQVPKYGVAMAGGWPQGGQQGGWAPQHHQLHFHQGEEEEEEEEDVEDELAAPYVRQMNNNIRDF